MTKSQRLKPVTKVAEDRERKAAQILGQSQRIVEERKKRLQELLAYRDEYQARFSNPATGGMSAYQAHDFRQFLCRLDQIIQEQERLLSLSISDLEEKKKAWMSTRSKAKALDKIVTRCRSEELTNITKREQHESDERSQRIRLSLGEGKNK